jgi:hypothetical protein
VFALILGSVNTELVLRAGSGNRRRLDTFWGICVCEDKEDQVRTQNFSFGEGGGGADPEAIYNLCLILKIML